MEVIEVDRKMQIEHGISGVAPWVGAERCAGIKEVLRQNAQLHEQIKQFKKIIDIATEEFKKKGKKIEELEKEVMRLRDENKQLPRKLEESEGKVRFFGKMLFGKRSEKIEEMEKVEEVEEDEDGEGFI